MKSHNTILKSYDVIVIGAGPAGLMAARELHEAKINYLLIDSKKVIGHPLKCAEGISEKAFLEFFKHKNYSFVRNTVHYHKIIYKDLTRILHTRFLQLDRPEWEKWMAKKLNILLNTRLEDIIVHKDHADIITNKGTLKSKMVILCTGCNYNIQKKYGLMKNEKESGKIAIAYGGIYKNHGLKSDGFYYFFDEEFYGYLWVFPKSKDIANIGVAFYPIRKQNPKLMLEKFLKKYNINAKQLSEYAGVIPCSGPIDKTYHDRMMVCGDAAGLVYAGTGEGIKYALSSGKIAASIAIEAIKKSRYDKQFLRKYETSWKKNFGSEMKAGMMFFDLTVAAARIGKIHRLFSAPTEKQVKNLVLEGKYPLKAWVGWKVCRLLGWTKLKDKKIKI